MIRKTRQTKTESDFHDPDESETALVRSTVLRARFDQGMGWPNDSRDANGDMACGYIFGNHRISTNNGSFTYSDCAKNLGPCIDDNIIFYLWLASRHIIAPARAAYGDLLEYLAIAADLYGLTNDNSLWVGEVDTRAYLGFAGYMAPKLPLQAAFHPMMSAPQFFSPEEAGKPYVNIGI